MAKLKADWLNEAQELGLDVTDNNTVAELKAAIDEAMAEIEAKSEAIEDIDESQFEEDEPIPAIVGEAQVYRSNKVPAVPQQASPKAPLATSLIDQKKIVKETQKGRQLAQVTVWQADGKRSGVLSHLYEKDGDFYVDGHKVEKMYSGTAGIVRYMTDDKRTWVVSK
jgi:hypothetical protein